MVTGVLLILRRLLRGLHDRHVEICMLKTVRGANTCHYYYFILNYLRNLFLTIAIPSISFYYSGSELLHWVRYRAASQCGCPPGVHAGFS